MSKTSKPPTAKFRPSALPMLDLCPKFEGKSSEYTDEGTKRHNALADHFRGKPEALENMDDDTKEGLQWAIDYIELKAPLLDYKIAIEQPLESVLPNGLKIQGTPDIVCGPRILDLKWRPRDYTAQMAAYAYMVLTQPPEEGQNEFSVAETTLLFANTQTARTQKWTVESAWDEILGIIGNAESAWAVATPCEYCGWCSKNKTCPALIQQVNIATASNPEWNLPQWHSSEMNTAQELGLALKIARTLADWCESVEFHAKEKAIKEGIIAEGFQIQTRQGNRFIPDIRGAFAAASLPQPEFLKACKVNFKSLAEIYAEFHGMKKAPAERDIEERLKGLVQRKSPSTFLVTERKPKTKKSN